MASLDLLDELLHEELKDIYDAEKQLTKALPILARKATAGELKEAFEAHLRQTEDHVERLEQVFEMLGVPARARKCVGMKNLLAEGEEMIREAEDEARDAVMIATAQKVEHYEIASYGTVRTWASLLGKIEIAALLEDTLEEEKEADQKLTGIADSFVNAAAEQGDAGKDDDDDNEEAPAQRQSSRARGASATRGGRQPVPSSRGNGRAGGAR